MSEASTMLGRVEWWRRRDLDRRSRSLSIIYRKTRHSNPIDSTERPRAGTFQVQRKVRSGPKLRPFGSKGSSLRLGRTPAGTLASTVRAARGNTVRGPRSPRMKAPYRLRQLAGRRYEGRD